MGNFIHTKKKYKTTQQSYRDESLTLYKEKRNIKRSIKYRYLFKTVVGKSKKLSGKKTFYIQIPDNST